MVEKQKVWLVDAARGIALLREQIEKARRLLDARPFVLEEHAVWSATTREYLVQIYGSRSPNIHSIMNAPGRKPTWLGMSDAALEAYMVSRLENQVEKLQGCVVSLKRKLQY